MQNLSDLEPIVDPKTGRPTPYFMRLIQNRGVLQDDAETRIGELEGRNLVAGAGLTGGGTLEADRTFDVGAGTGITVNADNVAIDTTAEAERIRDTMGTALVAGSGVTITPNDGADTITIAASAAGTVTTTGSPASGFLAKFSGASSITSGDLSGDVSTSGTLVTTIGANKVTNAMLAQIATATFKGRTTAGTGNVETLTATQATALLDTFTSALKGLAPASGGGTSNYLRADGSWAAPPGSGSYTDEQAQDAVGAMIDGSLTYVDATPLLQRAALTGDVTAAAGSNATTIANDAVTYAKMQNVSATSRILGRKTAGSGDTEECTLSEVLDFIGSAARGDLLYRGASAWSRLGAGSSGQFLTTNGAGADPAWSTPTGSSLGSGARSVLHTNVTQASCVGGTTSEQDLMTYSLPAGALAADGDSIEITAAGSFAADVTNKTVSIYFGGSTLATWTSSGSTTNHWRFHARVFRRSNTTQVCTLDSRSGIAGGTEDQHWRVRTTFPAETLSSAVNIRVACTTATAGAGRITAEALQVEKVAA